MFAPKAVACLEVGGMEACTYTTSWRCFAADEVLSKATAFETSGTSIDARVFGDLKTGFKERKAFQCSGRVGVSCNGE